jgi:hypothetical protein
MCRRIDVSTENLGPLAKVSVSNVLASSVGGAFRSQKSLVANLVAQHVKDPATFVVRVLVEFA